MCRNVKFKQEITRRQAGSNILNTVIAQIVTSTVCALTAVASGNGKSSTKTQSTFYKKNWQFITSVFISYSIN